jgi:hypothetical protein
MSSESRIESSRANGAKFAWPHHYETCHHRQYARALHLLLRRKIRNEPKKPHANKHLTKRTNPLRNHSEPTRNPESVRFCFLAPASMRPVLLPDLRVASRAPIPSMFPGLDRFVSEAPSRAGLPFRDGTESYCGCGKRFSADPFASRLKVLGARSSAPLPARRDPPHG